MHYQPLISPRCCAQTHSQAASHFVAEREAIEEKYSVRAAQEVQSNLAAARYETTQLRSEVRDRSAEVLQLRLQLTEAERQHEQLEALERQREAEAMSAMACEQVDLRREFRQKLWSATKEMVANITSQSDAQVRASMARAHRSEAELEKIRSNQRSRVWAAQHLVSATLAHPHDEIQELEHGEFRVAPATKSPMKKTPVKKTPVKKDGSEKNKFESEFDIVRDVFPGLHDVVGRSPSPRSKHSPRSKFSPQLSLGSLKNAIDDMINDDNF